MRDVGWRRLAALLVPMVPAVLAAAGLAAAEPQATGATLAAPAKEAAATAVPAAAGDTLRLALAACLARAEAAAPSLAAARAQVDEQAAVAAEAAARRYPVVGLGGGYQYASEHMRRDLVLGLGLPTRTLEFGDGHTADVNLGVSVPVFTGGELAATAAAAGVGHEAALRRGDSARLELARGVRQTWCGALGRQAQVDAARLAVGRLARHLESVRAAGAAGAATEEARLRAAARLNLAEQRLTQAEAARDSAELALGRLVGQPGRAVVAAGDLATPLLADADAPGVALDDRPDVAALALEQQRQRDLATAARGRLLPRVTADLRAHYGRPGVDALANDWMGYATAGVAVDWPLWDRGARSDRSRQAEARARWPAAQGSDLRDAIATMAAGARTALAAAATQERQAGERADLQRRLLAMVEGRLAQSAATETEYLDAQDDLAQAEVELALARTRLRLAETALLWALGR